MIIVSWEAHESKRGIKTSSVSNGYVFEQSYPTDIDDWDKTTYTFCAVQ
jgi:hypothetical protein